MQGIWKTAYWKFSKSALRGERLKAEVEETALIRDSVS